MEEGAGPAQAPAAALSTSMTSMIDRRRNERTAWRGLGVSSIVLRDFVNIVGRTFLGWCVGARGAIVFLVWYVSEVHTRLGLSMVIKIGRNWYSAGLAWGL